MNGLRSARRAGALAVALLGLITLGVRLALVLEPPTREAWTLIAITVDTSGLYARLSAASTGFYNHQITSRLVALPAAGFAIEHRAMLGPSPVSGDGIAGGADSLTRTDGVWHLRIAGNDVQARAIVTPRVPSAPASDCAPAPGALTGVLGSGDGTEASGALVLDGTAVVVHTLARGVVNDRALYVLGPQFAAGIDPLADCPAWVVSATKRWTGAAPEIGPGSEADVDLGDWHLHVRRLDDALKMDSYEQLLPIEHLAARIVGWPEPHQELQRVLVRVSGPGFTNPVPGLILDRTTR